jgi:lipopolysaccharide export system permease protein
MSIFELYDMAQRIRRSGGEIHKWQTELQLKFAFPLANLFVIFLCTPMVYNRRKKSLAVGFGISLLIVFVYFGIIQMGRTMGHKRELTPFVAAWIGNITALGVGFYNLHIARK